VKVRDPSSSKINPSSLVSGSKEDLVISAVVSPQCSPRIAYLIDLRIACQLPPLKVSTCDWRRLSIGTYCTYW